MLHISSASQKSMTAVVVIANCVHAHSAPMVSPLWSPANPMCVTDRWVQLCVQVHLACPQTLLPVLPLLTHELQVEVEAKRLAAIDLLGKLFTLPGSGMDEEYGYLFEEFLRRCKDQKVELLVWAACWLDRVGSTGLA